MEQTKTIYFSRDFFLAFLTLSVSPPFLQFLSSLAHVYGHVILHTEQLNQKHCQCLGGSQLLTQAQPCLKASGTNPNKSKDILNLSTL